LNVGSFELKATDLAGRIGVLETKTSRFETPALLPVIHPARQLIPCREIRAMGYEAVMTNAYTTFKRLSSKADSGIHKIIDFDGSVMTDSGGYQVLEFGSVEIDPVGMAKFEEKIGTDIAIILDRPTGLRVTRKFASATVVDTLEAAKRTKEILSRTDIIWTLPIQGGRYLDLVRKSAKESAKLGYECYALGSPVEVMEEYDFSLLVEMIRASKASIPNSRPFHLFGAGHPLILPLAVALGCDMFDSASYILYARNDRYISSSGTIRAESLEFLPCSCQVCCRITARELRSMKGEERVANIARHNLWVLQQVMEEIKQAIWEGRLWEYARAKCSGHPEALKAFKLAMSSTDGFIEEGTPYLKDRGIFINDLVDVSRPEITRHFQRIRQVNLNSKDHLVIVPEPRTKPFLTSDIFLELIKIVDPARTLVCSHSPVFGLIPSEISDVFPISQTTNITDEFPKDDFVLTKRKWKRIDVLVRPGDQSSAVILENVRRCTRTRPIVSKTHKAFKKKLRLIS
jgi:7-cyano-7-deazaguanine tRNA-ribosyltransferase